MKFLFKGFFLFIFLSISTHFFAQNMVMDVPKTNDGRYITQVNASESDVRLTDRSGLVSEMTLGIEWWTLLNEPIEKYLFRWKRGSSVFSNAHTLYLSESKLQKYPDLLTRYKQLKPQYIKLEIGVWLKHDDIYKSDNQAIFKSLPDCLKKSSYAQISGKTFYEMESDYGTRTINSNGHFYISKSGATGDDLSPGSPKDWSEFIKYTCSIDNRVGLALFKSSNTASFSLRVLEIKVPEKEINAIAKAYLERENPEESKEEEKQETKNENTKSSNNWDDVEESDTKNDGWASSDQTSKSNNSWENEQKTGNDWDTNKKSKSGWEKPAESMADKDRYQIKKKGEELQGVYDVLEKDMVIPYGKYHIYEYNAEAKMAKVAKLVGKKSEYTNGSCWGEKIKINIALWEIGFINKSQDWILEPEKNIDFGYSMYKASMDWQRANRCDTDDRNCQLRRAEKVKIERRRCKNQVIKSTIENLTEHYESQGYKSIFNF